MFHPIDYSRWERREIYENFREATFTLTAELDVTRFLEAVRQGYHRFYAAACWCIGGVANSDASFRYSLIDGRLGFFDTVNPHYTLKRTNSDLFTHNFTPYTGVYTDFARQFQKDKEAAEKQNSLYAYSEPQHDAIHITVMTSLAFTSLVYSKQTVSQGVVSYIPFVTMGRYHEQGGKTVMPVTTVFYHGVNDGIHAERFYGLLQKAFDRFPEPVI